MLDSYKCPAPFSLIYRSIFIAPVRLSIVTDDMIGWMRKNKILLHVWHSVKYNSLSYCSLPNDYVKIWYLRAILQESEEKLKMKNFEPPSIFVWR